MKDSGNRDNLLRAFRALSSGLKKNRTLLVCMSAMVVFMSTYLLILPALTLDEDEAVKHGIQTPERQIPEGLIRRGHSTG